MDREIIAGSIWGGKSVAIDGYPHLRKFTQVLTVGKSIEAAEERALRRIEEWLKICNYPVVSFSCGKDSTVIADLARRLKPDIMIVRHSSAEPHLPDVIEMLDYWRYELHANVKEWVFGSLFEWYKRWGLESPQIDAEYKRRAIAWQKEMGFDGACRGLRAEESSGRRKMAKNQKWTRLQQGVWMCDPILDWTADQVWGYIAKRGLPYASVYDKESDPDRNRRRLGSIWGVSGANVGRLVWLRRHYPDYYRYFVQHFPEVSRYT